MIVHALMAGGVGSRLYGPAGGLKPLEPIAPNCLLVDYVVDEGSQLGAMLTVIAISRDGQPVIDHVRSITKVEVRPVRQEFPGTGGAVATLIGESPEDAIMFLTTCDLYGERGEIASALNGAADQLESDEPVCVLATSSRMASDATPIFVHTSRPRSGKPARVMSYGKNVAPSAVVFSGARLLNPAFGRLFIELASAAEPGFTDTQIMNKIVSMGAAVYAVMTPSVFDIDDQESLQLARRIHHERSSRP